MPHYADGTPAQLGDQVVGVPYNQGGKQVVGVVVGIVPNSDVCNLRVAFHQRVTDPTKGYGSSNLHCYCDGNGAPPVFVETKVDAGAAKEFRLVRDVLLRAGPATPVARP